MAKKRTQTFDPVKHLTVVFDLGGVLSAGHNPIDQIHAQVGGERDAVESAYWQGRPAYDKGIVGPAEYWGSIAAASGIDHLSDEEVLDLQDVDDRYWATLDPRSRELIHDLARSGVRCAILSNANAAFGEYLRRQEWFEAFSVAIISGEERAVKPERALFDILLDVIAHDTGGVSRPGNVVFFDDLPQNVEAAKKLGIDAHVWPRNGGYPEHLATEARDAGVDLSRSGQDIAREYLTSRGLTLD